MYPLPCVVCDITVIILHLLLSLTYPIKVLEVRVKQQPSLLHLSTHLKQNSLQLILLLFTQLVQGLAQREKRHDVYWQCTEEVGVLPCTGDPAAVGGHSL